MGYRVVETESALEDLDEILSYLAVSLSNPSAAASFADDVALCYDTLEQMPYTYEKCRDPRLNAMSYRKAVVDHYIMIYRVSDENQTVYILRFFHGSQNYEKLL